MSLRKIFRNTFFVGVVAAASVLPMSCGGGGGGGKKIEPPVTQPPVISTIDDRLVDEGSTLVLDLNAYVSDADGEPVTISTTTDSTWTAGETVDGVYTYNDKKDDDSDNKVHTVRVFATNPHGSANAEFKITQNDLRSHISPALYMSGRYICYSPTNFNPNQGIFPTEQSIRDDLKVLLDANFEGIITYGSDNVLGQVSRIAKEEGFKKVIMGIWNPDSAEEWANALAAKDWVDGYCLGNEGLLFGRYTKQNLEQKMEDLRRATGKAVTTTEPHNGYDDELIENGDWIFPNVHPYWAGIKDPTQAVNWTVDRWNELKANGTRLNRAVQLKEVGLPSEGDTGLSEQNQNDYYRGLEVVITDYRMPYFEAFDQPWKQEGPGVGSHWGYFNSDRSRKKVSDVQLEFLTVSPIGDTSGYADGKALNVNPSSYNIATYIKVGGGWWFKPYWDELSVIGGNGYWFTDTTTGGTDYNATEVYAAIVTSDFDPENTSISYPPQSSDDAKVILGKFYTK